VLADKLAMKHALQNLVDNALKYGTEQNSWIGVFASAVKDETGSSVEVRVADHGPGIPLNEQPRIFDPFFRGQRALQDQVHGTGLGLNLVKKIVEAHGGTIWVNSQPAKGTEFVVRIPALAAGATG
jgi:two-component system phosphate regulon sensor histidine kinase PhoR